MKINSYIDYIQEGYIFSDKNLSVNLKKFINKEVNMLLIFGPCGSGKSTTGRILSKKYNVELLETDKMYWGMRYKRAKAELPKAERKEQVKAVEARLIKMLSENKRIIIEGVDWIEIYKKNKNIRPLMLEKGLIVLGLSAWKGGLRAGKRNAEHEKENSRWSETYNMTRINYKIFEPTLKQIRKDIKDIIDD